MSTRRGERGKAVPLDEWNGRGSAGNRKLSQANVSVLTPTLVPALSVIASSTHGYLQAGLEPIGPRAFIVSSQSCRAISIGSMPSSCHHAASLRPLWRSR
jgi:hypothetical protein